MSLHSLTPFLFTKHRSWVANCVRLLNDINCSGWMILDKLLLMHSLKLKTRNFLFFLLHLKVFLFMSLHSLTPFLFTKHRSWVANCVRLLFLNSCLLTSQATFSHDTFVAQKTRQQSLGTISPTRIARPSGSMLRSLLDFGRSDPEISNNDSRHGSVFFLSILKTVSPLLMNSSNSTGR